MAIAWSFKPQWPRSAINSRQWPLWTTRLLQRFMLSVLLPFTGGSECHFQLVFNHFRRIFGWQARLVNLSLYFPLNDLLYVEMDPQTVLWYNVSLGQIDWLSCTSACPFRVVVSQLNYGLFIVLYLWKRCWFVIYPLPSYIWPRIHTISAIQEQLSNETCLLNNSTNASYSLSHSRTMYFIITHASLLKESQLQWEGDAGLLGQTADPCPGGTIKCVSDEIKVDGKNQVWGENVNVA